ncbi:MAG: hypothetical protein J6Z74_03790 [Eubacterium sp.]|nr:hypothetical protein [Eubacterium sp.]
MRIKNSGLLILSVLICILFTGCGENKTQKGTDAVIGAFYKTFDGSDISFDAIVYEDGRLNNTAQGVASLNLDTGICEISMTVDDEVWNYSYEDSKVNKNEMRVMDLFVYNMKHSGNKLEGIQNSIISSLISQPPVKLDEFMLNNEEILEQREAILAQYRKVLYTDGEIYNIFDCDITEAEDKTTYTFTLNQENYPKVMAKLQVEAFLGSSSGELISEYETRFTDKIKEDGDKMYQKITVDKEGIITEIDLGNVSGNYRLNVVFR